MEATLDWSHRLLQPGEQLLFEQLSVFAGGFDFEAAQALVPGEDVLDGLATLVDSSLVLAIPAPQRMRYRLLEPVRQYAEARLGARGLRDATQRRHAEHYLRLARRAEAELRNGDAGPVLARLEEEEDNFRVALGWARDRSDDLGLRLCTALTPSWAIRGRVIEGRAWLDEMLRRRAGTGDLGLRASGLARASRLAWRRARLPVRPGRCSTRALPSAGSWTIRWASPDACGAWLWWPWLKGTSTRPVGWARRACPCFVVTVTGTASASPSPSWA